MADPWPVDPDVEPAPPADARPAAVALAVLVGGFAGGLARYATGLAWPTRAGCFPWATFGVNTGGAFLLAVILVTLARHFPATRYLRPLLATGFCGAFTTMSSVAVSTDQLAAHGRPGLAVAYAGGGLVAGLAASLLGALATRRLT